MRSAKIAAERALARAVLGLPERALLALAGKPRPLVDGKRINPRIYLLERLAERLQKPKMYQLPLERARREFVEQIRVVDLDRPADVECFDDVAPGPQGDVPVRFYRPSGLSSRAPLIVYFHGGGWVVGGIESHDGVCSALSRDARALVCSVDYRLAPEHPFPAALDDAWAAFVWAREQAARFGFDERRVAVMGDSAGGNLAAVVCQVARDSGAEAPCFAALIYPATDATRSLPTHKTFARGPFLEEATMEWFIDRYAPAGVDRRTPRLSPLFADDVSDLPPTLVVTAGFDPLLDEGRAYADRLEQAGVHVRYRCFDDMPHGFWQMAAVIEGAKAAYDEITATVREALGT